MTELSFPRISKFNWRNLRNIPGLAVLFRGNILQLYFSEEVFFLMSCNSETNHEGKIDYIEFVESYYDPAKSIGFNLAVLFTNLSEHMPSDVRLAKSVFL